MALNRIQIRLSVTIIVYFFIISTVSASVPLKDYAGRLARAEATIDPLTEGDHTSSKVLAAMSVVKQLLPRTESVDFDREIVRVDNSWLHEEIENVVKNVNGDIEQRRSMLVEIADRLSALRESVNASQSQQSFDKNDRRAQIERILSRPEYRPEEQRESTLKKWLRKLLEALARFLSRFDRSPARESGSVNGGTINAFRILITCLVLGAVVYGLIMLLKRMRGGRKSDKEKKVREVLGEEIPEEISAADLLAKARELARQGDYRTAIRRAYIAALFELEQRGKLRLHRSKTNRDYLDAMRLEREIFPSFSVMTGTFENVWYGQRRVDEDEFNGFISRYQETVK